MVRILLPLSFPRPIRLTPNLLHRQYRLLSTLPNNPHIYIHPPPSSSNSTDYTLSLLPTTPPTPSLSIGTSPTPIPTPSTFTTNPSFLRLLDSTLSNHACSDPTVIASASAHASHSGSTLGSGGAFFAPRRRRPQQQQQQQQQKGSSGNTAAGSDTGAGGASAQGGMGGAGRGGFVHVWDERRPPDFGRIPEPEDIFGSVEVDGEGRFVDGDGKEGEGKSELRGRYQSSGTYRVVTKEGVFGLSAFLREKLVERLREEERRLKS